MADVHPTAIVDAKATLSASAEIGPYSIIGPHVTIGERCVLKSHVVMEGHTTLGPDCTVGAFSTLGTPPQHTAYHGEPSRLIIGANTVIREHVSMHPGTERGTMETRVGEDCLFMVGSHVAHDCVIENNVIFSNGVGIGGHVHVEPFAILGGLAGVHQYVRIGKHAMIGGCSAVESDVIPYGSVKGNRAKLIGLNLVGLRRRGFSRDDIRSLRTAYGLLFGSGGQFAERVDEVAELFPDHAGVQDIIHFIRSDSSRALCQPTAQNGNGA